MLQKPIYIDDWSFWVTLTDEEVKIGQKMGGNRDKSVNFRYIFGPTQLKFGLFGPF